MKREKFPTSLLLNQQMFLYRTLVYLMKASKQPNVFYTHSKSHSVRINQVFSQHDFYNNFQPTSESLYWDLHVWVVSAQNKLQHKVSFSRAFISDHRAVFPVVLFPLGWMDVNYLYLSIFCPSCSSYNWPLINSQLSVMRLWCWFVVVLTGLHLVISCILYEGNRWHLQVTWPNWNFMACLRELSVV